MTLKTDNAPSGRASHSPALWLIHIAALTFVLMWGVSFVSTRVLILHHMGPVEIYVYRFAVAYLMILLISHKRFRSYSWRDEWRFMLCGLSAGSIYFIAENTALKYTFTTNVSLLTSLSPLITIFLLAFIYKSEKPGRGMVLGSFVAFIGAACVIFNSSSNNEVGFNPLGDLLSIAAAFSWAVYSIILRGLSANYDVWFITRKTFFYGVITALPFLAFGPQLNNPIELLSDTMVLTNLLFLSVGCSAVAYLLWSLCVRHLGAVTANNYMYLQAVVTMIAAYFIVNEPITAIGIIGCALVIGGLWIGEKLNRRPN